MTNEWPNPMPNIYEDAHKRPMTALLTERAQELAKDLKTTQEAFKAAENLIRERNEKVQELQEEKEALKQSYLNMKQQRDNLAQVYQLQLELQE